MVGYTCGIIHFVPFSRAETLCIKCREMAAVQSFGLITEVPWNKETDKRRHHSRKLFSDRYLQFLLTWLDRIQTGIETNPLTVWIQDRQTPIQDSLSCDKIPQEDTATSILSSRSGHTRLKLVLWRAHIRRRVMEKTSSIGQWHSKMFDAGVSFVHYTNTATPL